MHTRAKQDVACKASLQSARMCACAQTWFEVKVYDRWLDLIQVLERCHGLKDEDPCLWRESVAMSCWMLCHMKLTSFSGRVLVCLRRKSKSLPSMYSRTVQNLRSQDDTMLSSTTPSNDLRVRIDLKHIKELHYVLQTQVHSILTR